MSSPINYDVLPEELAGPLGTWEEELGKFYSELLRAAGDTAGHLDVYVGAYLDMGTEELQRNAEACTAWENYLLNDMWAAVENAWLAVQTQDGIPAEAIALDQHYRQLCSSAQLVLLALQGFFWSILNDTTSIEGLKRQAMDEFAEATEGGKPNTAPLPNPWNATPSLIPRNILVREILVSHDGLTQYTNVTDGDINDFAGLRG